MCDNTTHCECSRGVFLSSCALPVSVQSFNDPVGVVLLDIPNHSILLLALMHACS